MKTLSAILISLIIFLLSFEEGITEDKDIISLPAPHYDSNISLEKTIFQRMSIRNFSNEPLNIEEVSQLLWAAGGMTCDGVTGATRAYPSAGAAYPLEIYAVVGNVDGIKPGIYRYQHGEHQIVLIKNGDFRKRLMEASSGQKMIQNVPFNIIFAADCARMTGRYGDRGYRYVYMDAGHAGQNIYLQAEAMGLGTVAIGAFRDDAVKDILGLKNEEPVYIMPVGKKTK